VAWYTGSCLVEIIFSLSFLLNFSLAFNLLPKRLDIESLSLAVSRANMSFYEPHQLIPSSMMGNFSLSHGAYQHKVKACSPYTSKRQSGKYTLIHVLSERYTGYDILLFVLYVRCLCSACRCLRKTFPYLVCYLCLCLLERFRTALTPMNPERNKKGL